MKVRYLTQHLLLLKISPHQNYHETTTSAIDSLLQIALNQYTKGHRLFSEKESSSRVHYKQHHKSLSACFVCDNGVTDTT